MARSITVVFAAFCCVLRSQAALSKHIVGEFVSPLYTINFAYPIDEVSVFVRFHTGWCVNVLTTIKQRPAQKHGHTNLP